MAERKLSFGRAGSTAAVLLFVLWLGSVVLPQTATTGELQKVEPQEPFLAGDERSIPILKDSLATLKQIDARLERIDARLERIEKLIPAQRQR
jgi:hypothetical protein